MPNNYVLLERIELNASATSITFANIPQTGYTDLKVVVSARTDYNSTISSLGVHLNTLASDTSYRWLRGNGSVAASGNDSSQQDFYIGEVPALTATANTFGNAEVYIPNYTGSQQKSMSADGVGEQNGTTAYAYFSAGLSTKTAAINSVTVRGFAGSSGNLVSGSTFSLYGLAALGTTPAIAPKASGGNTIDYDGTYWIHTFLSSGTFTPQVGLTCDYLVVAGGGGGGDSRIGGGGGAGGYRTSAGTSGGGAAAESALSLLSGTGYTVTVGAGGASSGTDGTTGSNSVFSTITSNGGGGGTYGSNGLTGGSGGGAGGNNGLRTGGAGTANQGYAGGSSTGGSGEASYAGGGGGGAAAVGSNATVSSNAAAGSGGNGVSSSITSTAVTRAGGGGGGMSGTSSGAASSGGTGGGGAGGKGANGVVGTVNTGGGGGGAGINSGSNFLGGAGGSGIVIIRYPAA
jgi:hypothetical protein